MTDGQTEWSLFHEAYPTRFLAHLWIPNQHFAMELSEHSVTAKKREMDMKRPA